MLLTSLKEWQTIKHQKVVNNKVGCYRQGLVITNYFASYLYL